MSAIPQQVAEIAIGGMTCGACSSAVTNALENVDGVSFANVSLVTERATVKYDDNVNVASLLTAIEDAGFDAESIQTKNSSVDKPSRHSVEIQISGMTCTNCSNSITNALQQSDCVEAVSVSLATDIAYITIQGSYDPQTLVTTIEDAGFEAQIIKDIPLEDEKHSRNEITRLEIKIFGVNSDDDSQRAESVSMTIDGVNSVNANFMTAVIEFDNTIVGVRTIFRKLEESGFTALIALTADNTQQVEALKRVKELKSYYYGALFSFALGVPIIFFDKFRKYMPHFLTAKIGRGIWLDDSINMASVTPILFGPARRFYVKAYKALRSHAPTMDVLVTASVSSAFIYSCIAFIHSIVVSMPTHQMYLWDACAMILMFVLLGKYFENLARGQTSQALAELISLVPEESLVIAKDTNPQGKLIATDMLEVGDIVVLRPGERLSADGVVVDGESFVSESLSTGESAPVHKVPGDLVVGGSINGLGALKFRVTNCGADTRLAQIVEFIKEAQSSRTPIQRYADVAAAKFVPAVMTLALLTFIGWLIIGALSGTERMPMMFHHNSSFFTCLRLGIAVVVVACPCALGLATPTAVMVATTVGAKHGILVKGGGIFEMGAQASVVLFDKTGTLTTGKMSVISENVPAQYWPNIRALESFSEHPAGKALAEYAHSEEIDTINQKTDQKLVVNDVQVKPGKGIQGKIHGTHYFVGRCDRNSGIEVVVDGEKVGQIELRDTLRAESAEVVEKLFQMGYTVGIISGDGARAVDLIASELGINPEWTWSRLRPEDKVEVVNNLKASGKHVVFVGDGINDSPALVAASVGMSSEGSTHVAVESADIVLTQHSPVSGVPAALDLCRTTMRRIKVNLFSSIIYNAVMIPFAMGFLLPFNIMSTPVMASAAMAMSSVSVVLSSLLLKTWTPDGRKMWARLLPRWPTRLWRSDQFEYQPV